MCEKHKFLLCKHCGNIAVLVVDKGVPMACCGENMTELLPNTVEASAEKHLPVADVSGDSMCVRVGSAPHPMEEAHHIAFVYVKTGRGGQRKVLHVGETPELDFCFTGDKPVAVYAYCNLHGLWKSEIA